MISDPKNLYKTKSDDDQYTTEIVIRLEYNQMSQNTIYCKTAPKFTQLASNQPAFQNNSQTYYFNYIYIKVKKKLSKEKKAYVFQQFRKPWYINQKIYFSSYVIHKYSNFQIYIYIYITYIDQLSKIFLVIYMHKYPLKTLKFTKSIIIIHYITIIVFLIF